MSLDSGGVRCACDVSHEIWSCLGTLRVLAAHSRTTPRKFTQVRRPHRPYSTATSLQTLAGIVLLRAMHRLNVVIYTQDCDRSDSTTGSPRRKHECFSRHSGKIRAGYELPVTKNLKAETRSRVTRYNRVSPDAQGMHIHMSWPSML